MTSSLWMAVHLLSLLTIYWLHVSCAHDVTCSNRQFIGDQNVDIKIPAIFGIRKSLNDSCGDISPQAFQAAVALNWATSLLNGEQSPTNTSFIPGVKLGVDIYDDCGQSYLTAAIAGDLASSVKGVRSCLLDNDGQSVHHLPVAGFLGTELSRTTPVLTDTVLDTHLPVVGISATMPELSDKHKYPNFMRTVPSDLRQAQAIIQIAKHYQWTYIVAVYTTDNYGIQGMQEVRRLAKLNRICISSEEAFDLWPEPSIEKMENFVRNTLYGGVENSNGSFGVIYFGQEAPLVSILTYMKDHRGKWVLAGAFLQKIYCLISEAVSPSSELAALLNVFKEDTSGIKAVLITPPRTSITSFEDYFFQFVESPPDWAVGTWRTALKEQMNSQFGCPSYNFTRESLEGCDIRSKTRFSGYLAATLDAVYLLATTVKRLHQTHCGINASGVCPELENRLDSGLLLTDEMANLDYSTMGADYVPEEFVNQSRKLINVSGDFHLLDQVTYSVVANVEGGRFTEIGHYINDHVTISPTYDTLLGRSECTGKAPEKKCSECADVDTMRYIYSPGDYVILGIYSIHWGDSGFGCGQYREKSHSYFTMAGFMNGIQWLKQSTGLNFGYLIIDDCYNPLPTNRIILKILSGDLQVDDGNGTVFDPTRVIVAVGAQSSPVTMAVVPMLQLLNISTISYSSTNANLDNRITYPFFSRTLSSDQLQAKVLQGVLDQLQVTYVGALVIKNSYGLELYQMFRELAEAKGICVEDAFEMTETTDQQAIQQVLEHYRSMNIKVIITIAMDTIVTNVLEATLDDDAFVFVGSEAWGLNPKLLEGDHGERAQGALVLAVPVQMVDYGLKNYIQQIQPFHEEADSWLIEFWQEHFKCNLPGQFDKTREYQCPEKSSGEYFSDTEATSKAQTPITVHSTYATISAGLAVSKLAKLGTDSLKDPRLVTKEIRNVELTTKDGRLFKPFIESGNGNVGFSIYNVQQVGSKYEYIKVGYATGEGDITVDFSKLKFYDTPGREIKTVVSSCLFRSGCRVCADNPVTTDPGPTNITSDQTTSVVASDSSTSTAVIALAVICPLVFVLILVAVVIGILCCRGKLSWKKKQDDTFAQYSGSVSSYTVNSDSVAPRLPPSRRKSSMSRDRLSNADIQDVTLGQDLQANLHTHTPSVASGLEMPVLSDNQTTNAITLPPPRPHKLSTQNIAASRSSVSPAESQHLSRGTPSPQFGPPPVLLRTDENNRFAAHPSGALILHETQVNPNPMPSPHSVTENTNVCRNYPPQPGTVVSAIPERNNIMFTNVADKEIYTLDDLAKYGPNNDESHYWYVRTADGRLVPYENVVYASPPALPHLQNQDLASSQPLNIVKVGSKPVQMAATSVPRNEVLLDPQNVDGFYGYPAIQSHAAKDPTHYPLQKKYQDDYITARDCPVSLPQHRDNNNAVKTDGAYLHNPENGISTIPINHTSEINDRNPTHTSDDFHRGSIPAESTNDPDQDRRPRSLHVSDPVYSSISSPREGTVRLSPSNVDLSPNNEQPTYRSKDAATESPTVNDNILNNSHRASTTVPFSFVYPDSPGLSKQMFSNSLNRKGNNDIHRISDIPEVDLESDSLV